MRQLTLNLQLNERVTFDHFIVGSNNQLVSALKKIPESAEFSWYLWGEKGVGRTHLLQSCAHAAHQLSLKVMYIALADYPVLSPDIIRGIDQYDLVLWDDVDAIAGLNQWEVALFHAYNQLQASDAKLICTASASPLASQIQLPDFRTRLASGLTFQVKSLRDEEKLTALQQRARSRGMQLSDPVGNYLMSHYSRDMPALLAFLDELDAVSLQEKRLLTIPFVKSVLKQLE